MTKKKIGPREELTWFHDTASGLSAAYLSPDQVTYHCSQKPSASLRNFTCAQYCVRLYTSLLSLTPQENLENLNNHMSDAETPTLAPLAQAHAVNMYLDQEILKMSILSRVS